MPVSRHSQPTAQGQQRSFHVGPQHADVRASMSSLLTHLIPRHRHRPGLAIRGTRAYEMDAVATAEDVDCTVAHSLGIGLAEIGPVVAGDGKSAGRAERGAVGQHDLSVIVAGRGVWNEHHKRAGFAVYGLLTGEVAPDFRAVVDKPIGLLGGGRGLRDLPGALVQSQRRVDIGCAGCTDGHERRAADQADQQAPSRNHRDIHRGVSLLGLTHGYQLEALR